MEEPTLRAGNADHIARRRGESTKELERSIGNSDWPALPHVPNLLVVNQNHGHRRERLGERDQLRGLDELKLVPVL
jgi:hypothetical protein